MSGWSMYYDIQTASSDSGSETQSSRLASAVAMICIHMVQVRKSWMTLCHR